jgi:hypothetical protein
MPDAPLPLDALTRQISQRESELERLRRDYQQRQARLADLARRREELQAQLRQVEDDIQAVTRGRAGGAAPPAARAAATPPAAKPRTPAAARPTLTEALVGLLGEGPGPRTVKQLAEELARRRFPTASGNLPHLVKNRVADLVRRGLLRRAAGQAGVILAAPPAPATKAAGATPAVPAKGAARKAAPPRPGASKGQRPLREVLTDLLRKSRRPLSPRELAEQALAAGHTTTSQDFAEVVRSALAEMGNAERAGQGWRLKTQ